MFGIRIPLEHSWLSIHPAKLPPFAELAADVAHAKVRLISRPPPPLRISCRAKAMPKLTRNTENQRKPPPRPSPHTRNSVASFHPRSRSFRFCDRPKVQGTSQQGSNWGEVVTFFFFFFSVGELARNMYLIIV